MVNIDVERLKEMIDLLPDPKTTIQRTVIYNYIPNYTPLGKRLLEEDLIKPLGVHQMVFELSRYGTHWELVTEDLTKQEIMRKHFEQ